MDLAERDAVLTREWYKGTLAKVIGTMVGLSESGVRERRRTLKLQRRGMRRKFEKINFSMTPELKEEIILRTKQLGCCMVAYLTGLVEQDLAKQKSGEADA